MRSIYLKLSFFAVALLLLSIVVVKFLELRAVKLNEFYDPVIAAYVEHRRNSNTDTSLVLLGDSRMAQWQYSWPKELSVVNMGVNGSTTTYALKRLDYVLKLKPEWVAIQVGVNDVVASRMLWGQERKEVLNQSAKNIIEMTKILLESDINVIFMSVIPGINTDLARYFFWQGDLSSPVSWLNAEVKKNLPRDVVIMDIEPVFQNETGNWRKGLTIDALHWNDNAYSILSEHLIKIMSTR
jgi:lysophospholipase L1-like esterase